MNEYQDQDTWYVLVSWSHTAGGYVQVGPDAGFDTLAEANAYADRHFPITPVEPRRRRGIA